MSPPQPLSPEEGRGEGRGRVHFYTYSLSPTIHSRRLWTHTLTQRLPPSRSVTGPTVEDGRDGTPDRSGTERPGGTEWKLQKRKTRSVDRGTGSGGEDGVLETGQKRTDTVEPPRTPDSKNRPLFRISSLPQIKRKSLVPKPDSNRTSGVCLNRLVWRRRPSRPEPVSRDERGR